MAKIGKKGFTLIELLVTVLIIMILAGYAIFAYLESLHEAENTLAKSRMEVINAGFERFELEHPSLASSPSGVFTDADNISSCNLSGAGSLTSKLIGCGYVQKQAWDSFTYEYGLGNLCGNCEDGCDGYVYMRGKPELEELGEFNRESGYCAGISVRTGGRATDGQM